MGSMERVGPFLWMLGKHSSILSFARLGGNYNFPINEGNQHLNCFFLDLLKLS